MRGIVLGSRGPNPHILAGVALRQARWQSEKAESMDFLKPRLIPMNRRRRIYEGKAKVLYEGPEPGTLIQHFKDDATAFNAKKHEVIEGKGVLKGTDWLHNEQGYTVGAKFLYP